jgi:hypothetical protein
MSSPEETIGSVILRFARTVDREFLVPNGGRKLVGTLALVDIILAAQHTLPRLLDANRLRNQIGELINCQLFGKDLRSQFSNRLD